MNQNLVFQQSTHFKVSVGKLLSVVGLCLIASSAAARGNFSDPAYSVKRASDDAQEVCNEAERFFKHYHLGAETDFGCDTCVNQVLNAPYGTKGAPSARWLLNNSQMTRSQFLTHACVVSRNRLSTKALSSALPQQVWEIPCLLGVATTLDLNNIAAQCVRSVKSIKPPQDKDEGDGAVACENEEYQSTEDLLDYITTLLQETKDTLDRLQKTNGPHLIGDAPYQYAANPHGTQLGTFNTCLKSKLKAWR